MVKRLAFVVAFWLSISTVASAEIPPPPPPDVPNPLGLLATLDVMTLIPADDPAMTDPGVSESSTYDPPHLSRGGPFRLVGPAKKDVDPENPFNEVISFDTTCGPGGTAPTCVVPNDPRPRAVRRFGGQTKIHMLDDQVELKYFFIGRTCAGDGPRIQLAVDTDGNGTSNGNAFGHLGDKPFGGGCAMNIWVYEDMTNIIQKWDLSKFPGSGAFCVGNNAMICSWNEMENFFNTMHPNHQVLNAVLVDDATSFAPTSRGCAYFDLLSAGSRTLIDHREVSGGDGDQPNNC